MSKFEDKIAKIFDDAHIRYKREVSFPDLKSLKGKPLRFDFALLDNNGRICITGPLMNYASLNKECVIIGVGERIEIWDQDMFNNFFNENIDNFSDVAENLFNAY